MKAKLLGNIFYIFDTTPQAFTMPEGAVVAYVQEELLGQFQALNEGTNIEKYNYCAFVVNQPVWAPYINDDYTPVEPEPEPEPEPEVAWAAYSDHITIGNTGNKTSAVSTLSNTLSWNGDFTNNYSDTAEPLITTLSCFISDEAEGVLPRSISNVEGYPDPYLFSVTCQGTGTYDEEQMIYPYTIVHLYCDELNFSLTYKIDNSDFTVVDMEAVNTDATVGDTYYFWYGELGSFYYEDPIETCPSCGTQLDGGVCPNSACPESPYYEPQEEYCPTCGTPLEGGVCPNPECPASPDYVEPEPEEEPQEPEEP